MLANQRKTWEKQSDGLKVPVYPQTFEEYARVFPEHHAKHIPDEIVPGNCPFDPQRSDAYMESIMCRNSHHQIQ
eukprot:618823-Karenia_brevis.AAC.1